MAWPAGTIVAARYRILRLLGRGGMGEVYEAEDLDLRDHVALKTVRSDIEAEPLLLERFKREIQIARRINHPNVCRIYDVGYHQPAAPEGSTGAAPIRFVTMELLPGDTLSERVARSRRLSLDEALPIIDQIAAGLDAVHSAGIIHRDFKSGNVILAQPADARRGVRAVVTDFGLARPENTTDSMTSISDTGRIAGTPAYMAPEQVEAKPLTPAADVYAFGIVIYEMVTGVRPFDGGSAISVAARRLTERPAAPSQHAPGLDPRWEETILRCLDRDPAARPSALQIPRALRGELPASAAAPASHPETVWLGTAPSKRRPLTIAAAGLGVLMTAALGYTVFRKPAAPSPAANASVPATPVRRGVAVLGFKNVSGRPEFDWLSTAIAEILTTDLAVGGKLRTIPGPEVSRMRADLGLAIAETYSKQDLSRVRQNLAVDLIAGGSYSIVEQAGGSLLRVDLRLQDAASGETVASGGATGTEKQFFDLVSRAATPVREALGLPRTSPSQQVGIEATLPESREAARLYTEGLAKLRTLDAQAAQQALSKAAAIEPKHALTHSALAAAWQALGYEAKAKEEAQRASELAASLPESERPAIEARAYETAKSWAKAIDAYRALFDEVPDNLEIGLKLAEAQVAGGKSKEALATIEQLRKLPAALAEDPRLGLIAALAFHRLGDSKQSAAAANAAARKALATGARVLAARALILEATALERQGHADLAAKSTEQARSLFEAVGDRGGMARSVERQAIALRSKGDLNGSARLLESALETHRQIGDQSSVARVLNNLGRALLDQGKIREAAKYHDEALTVFRRIDAKYEAAVALNDIAAQLQARGDLAGASAKYQEALDLFSSIGRKGGVALALTNLGEVSFYRGDLPRSRQLHEEALALNRETNQKAGAGYDLYRLGEVFRAKGDLRVAADRYQEARKLQQEVGDKVSEADTIVGLSSLALAEKRFKEAEAMARQAEEVLRGEDARDRAAAAAAVLADALLSQGKLDAARALVKTAGPTWQKSQDRLVRLNGALTAARAQAASRLPGDVKEATRALGSVLGECTTTGFVPCQFEVRLALGALELSSGSTASGRERLTALTRDAEARGFGRVARDAAEFLR